MRITMHMSLHAFIYTLYIYYIQVSQDVEDMWRQLYHLALEQDDLNIAIKAAKALGDIATASYLTRLSTIMTDLEVPNPRDHYLFRAKMALLRKDLVTAEHEYISNNKIKECIDMYTSLMKYEDAIRIASQNSDPSESDMRHDYYNYLINTKQYDIAAQLKEQEGEYIQAIELYLKGNQSTKAAYIIFTRKIYQPTTLLDTILNSLIRGGVYDVVGEFYEYLDDFPHAIDYYQKG